MSKVIHEGWMARIGRRKIGPSFMHMRYFVLEPRLLLYYKKKPQEKDRQVPLKTLLVDGNCRVEDRGLKTHHGHMVYVLCVYNKHDAYLRITMAAFNIQESLIWKEKIELVIDQQGSLVANDYKAITSSESAANNGRNGFSSGLESQCNPDEGEESQQNLARRKTIGHGLPDSVLDWTRESDSGLSIENNTNDVLSRKHWRLVKCQNGLRIFEELQEVDKLPRSISRAMKAVGVVDATCEAVFGIVMSMDGTRFEWDSSFQYGSLVEEVDGHTAILYHRLQLDFFYMFLWPRDLCYVRYWRRNDDGSYVVLFRSREHANCGPQPGFVRAHVESGGFKISPLKPRSGRPRTQVQHLMQIDLKGWGLGYIPSFQQHCLLQMLNSVSGLREWFSQEDEVHTVQTIPVMVNMASDTVSCQKDQKTLESDIHHGLSLDQMHSTCKNSAMLDEDSDDDEDYQITALEQEQEESIKPETGIKQIALDEDTSELDLSCFYGNLRRDDRDNSRDCWRISDGNNFRIRGRNFLSDKTKILGGKHLMELAAVDWLKDTKRMDHVARRQGCAVQVASEKGLFSLAINLQIPGSTYYSMVFYFVTRRLDPGSLLQRFVDGDDEFRNSRFKLIPAVPKGSWIVRQSVGSNPCLLGKAVDCTYIRGSKYLEIDIDIGSSTVANGVLGLVFGVVKTLVVDMAFLMQANTADELPERLIGAVRMSHIELSSAVVSVLEASSPEQGH